MVQNDGIKRFERAALQFPAGTRKHGDFFILNQAIFEIMDVIELTSGTFSGDEIYILEILNNYHRRAGLENSDH